MLFTEKRKKNTNSFPYSHFDFAQSANQKNEVLDLIQEEKKFFNS
jgi:hypothetical protein